MLTKNNNNNASENCFFGGKKQPKQDTIDGYLGYCLKWGWGNDQGLNEKEQEEECVNENP